MWMWAAYGELIGKNPANYKFPMAVYDFERNKDKLPTHLNVRVFVPPTCPLLLYKLHR